MRAAIYHGVRDIRVEEVPRPRLEAGFLLVEMKRCGICGSDVHSYNGLWEQPTIAHGHEVSGVVAECGEGVGEFRVGDRVCMEWFSHCGTCRFCRVGKYNLCNSLARTSGKSHAGFADFVVAHQSSLFRLPDSLSFEEGALVEPLAVSYRAVRRSSREALGTLLVIGAGTIGLLAVSVARALGARAIIASARHDHQAALASRFGAAEVLRENVAQKVINTYGGADAVIETTASPAGLHEAFTSVRKGGRVVLVGGFVKSLDVDLKSIVDNELSVLGSFCYGYSGMRRDFDSSIELIASRKVLVRELITHRFGLAAIATAFETALDKNSRSVKVEICQEM
jgi:2-desacetyl-2-hydroxyethyl bacteriochlorophyllide A dehydrogenase